MFDLSSRTTLALAASALLPFYLITASADQRPIPGEAGSGARTADRGGESVAKPSCATLSSLGIDFGAADVARCAEIGLSAGQKKQVFHLMNYCQPKIEGLCKRMTRALEMDESDAAAREAKQLEFEAVTDAFEKVQAEIISGLHSIVSAEQRERLDALRERDSRGVAKSRVTG